MLSSKIIEEREQPKGVASYGQTPKPRSYVESVARTAVAGPRAQDSEPKSFSSPAAQAYGHETPLRNGTLGGSFVSPSPLSTSSPILSADR
ncbi:Tensin-1 [Saguinus oedipus]|uniref:Tensin-1 n=1 Tax=Saguinus oedipus TaxID=9490 RepID=A0ABQ9VGL3_SAGOE|nr:Tensin-1 [Saguinus oedipus]